MLIKSFAFYCHFTFTFFSVEEREVSKATELSSSPKRNILGRKRISFSEKDSSPNFLRPGRWWDLIDVLKPYRDTIFSFFFPFHFSKSSWLGFLIIWCCCLSLLSVSQVFAQLEIVFIKLRYISEGFLRCRTKWSIPMKKQNFWYFSLIVQNSGTKKEGKEEKKKSF